MRAPSRAFQQSLALVRRSAADVVELSDAILFALASTRNNARPLIKEALQLLIRRAQQAIEALEQEGQR